MNYPQITALVPNGEHFDLSALNEGIWLTVGHVNAIEQALAASGQSIATITGERDAAVTSLSQAQEAANTAAAQAATDLQTANATITTLQAEITALKSGPAGQFSATTATEDPAATAVAKVPAHDSADHPLNKMADKFFPPANK